MATKKKVSKKKAPSKKVETVDSIDVSNELLDRLAVVEARQALLVKGFRWAAKQITPVFGIGLVGQVFDELANKLEK